MYGMFNGCSNLRTIYVGSGWSTAAVTNSTYMFNSCTSLVGGQGTTYNANHVDAAYAHIDGGPSNPGYFTLGNEAYACYTPSNTTFTFYYDNQRSSRTGRTYNLNTGENYTVWSTDGTNANVTKVVFDPSFAAARPTSTYNWFHRMNKLESIQGIEYLNTSEVTNMSWMFSYCTSLTSLDLSSINTSKVTEMKSMFYGSSYVKILDLRSFNTSKVTDMSYMFASCSGTQTIYVGEGWSTAAVTSSSGMFNTCTSLVGGQGTTYNDSNPKDKTYAHIDGGPSNPGYFTAKSPGLRGDADGDGEVSISDVSKLTDYLLTGNASGVNLTGADADQDGEVAIADVSAIIDYLLSGTW
jgi:surface protein